MSEKRTKASSTLCDIATGREEEEGKGRGRGCDLWLRVKLIGLVCGQKIPAGWLNRVD